MRTDGNQISIGNTMLSENFKRVETKKTKMTKKTILASTLLLLLHISSYGQWTQLPNLTRNVISVFISNNNLIAGTDTGIYYSSNNGGSWNAATGINTTATSFAKGRNKLLVSSHEKLWQSTNDGASWSALPTIYTFQDVNRIVIRDTHYIAGMKGAGLWYSTDYGTSWISVSTSWQGNNSDLVFKKNRLFASYQSSGYLQVSNNFGQIWNAPGSNGIKTGQSSSVQDIYCLAVKNDSILIAGTKNFGLFTSYDGVYFSYDDGNNWTKKINGLTTKAINSLAVAGNVVFAGTHGGGVFYSADDGDNWTALNTGLSNLTINKLYINGTTLYAGVSTGLFTIDICPILKNNSTLYSASATTISSGDSVKLLANYGGLNYQWFRNGTLILGTNNNVFFATSSGNYKAVIFYSTNCSDTTNSIAVFSTGLNDNLLRNSGLKIYPNPSGGAISIEYSAPPITGPYELILYNATGNLTKSISLLNIHSKITVENLQAGIYYAVMRSRTYTSQPQKFIIIK